VQAKIDARRSNGQHEQTAAIQMAVFTTPDCTERANAIRAYGVLEGDRMKPSAY
jgi:hypothetical protein